MADRGRARLRRIDRTSPVAPARFDLDEPELEGRDASWWDADGPAAVLHAMNGPRLNFYRRAIGTVVGRRILDAGCGGGLVAAALVTEGAHVVGLDRSLPSLSVARRAARGGFTPVAGLLERLPFADSSFEVVVAADVLEHVGDLPASVAEIRRVLVQDGSLVFDTINRTAWAWVTAIWGAERVTGLIPRGTHDWRLFIRPAELDRLLAGNGMRTVATLGLGPALDAAKISRAVTSRHLEVPEFRTGKSRIVSYLGHYRKVAA